MTPELSESYDQVRRLEQRVAELRSMLSKLVDLSENISIDEFESEEEDLDAFYGCRCDARLLIGS